MRRAGVRTFALEPLPDPLPRARRVELCRAGRFAAWRLALVAMVVCFLLDPPPGIVGAIRERDSAPA